MSSILSLPLLSHVISVHLHLSQEGTHPRRDLLPLQPCFHKGSAADAGEVFGTGRMGKSSPSSTHMLCSTIHAVINFMAEENCQSVASVSRSSFKLPHLPLKMQIACSDLSRSRASW